MINLVHLNCDFQKSSDAMQKINIKNLNIPEYRCLLIGRVQYLYTIEHAVENIAYHRFQLISVTLLSLIRTNVPSSSYLSDNCPFFITYCKSSDCVSVDFLTLYLSRAIKMLLRGKIKDKDVATQSRPSCCLENCN